MRPRAGLSASVAASLLSLLVLGVLGSPPASAQDGGMDRLYVTIHATSSGINPVFVRNLIVVGAVPTLVNVTVINDDPLAMEHSFSIGTAADPQDKIVDTGTFPAGLTRYVEFIVWENTIESGGRNETAEAAAGGGIRFYCIPHRVAGMVGRIVIGGLPATAEEAPEKGVFLRAYWIGVLGMAGTLLLIGISYFVIKSSSRHFTDHHEHIRRGGP